MFFYSSHHTEFMCWFFVFFPVKALFVQVILILNFFSVLLLSFLVLWPFHLVLSDSVRVWADGEQRSESLGLAAKISDCANFVWNSPSENETVLPLLAESWVVRLSAVCDALAHHMLHLGLSMCPLHVLIPVVWCAQSSRLWMAPLVKYISRDNSISMLSEVQCHWPWSLYAPGSCISEALRASERVSHFGSVDQKQCHFLSVLVPWCLVVSWELPLCPAPPCAVCKSRPQSTLLVKYSTAD